jgi:NTP pyrophosphatase (non-canonical NTP hydrolase)
VPKTLNQIAWEVHALAWEKGFHPTEEEEDAFIEKACNNLHDEVSELHEAWRNNKLHEFCDKRHMMESLGIPPLTCVEEEYADLVIRALDDMIELGINPEDVIDRKHRFNKTRPYKHGGKRS